VSEKAHSWLLQERHKRVLLVNEIKNDGAKVALSSTELKKLASSGDTLKGRQNYDRSAQEFKLQGLPVVLCNDRPKIKPLDTGVRNRPVELHKQYSFMQPEALQHEQQRGNRYVQQGEMCKKIWFSMLRIKFSFVRTKISVF
jgi:phage/plasmid-associated DNA primase